VYTLELSHGEDEMKMQLIKRIWSIHLVMQCSDQFLWGKN
jgi:hypothetical protein